MGRRAAWWEDYLQHEWKPPKGGVSRQCWVKVLCLPFLNCKPWKPSMIKLLQITKQPIYWERNLFSMKQPQFWAVSAFNSGNFLHSSLPSLGDIPSNNALKHSAYLTGESQTVTCSLLVFYPQTPFLETLCTMGCTSRCFPTWLQIKGTRYSPAYYLTQQHTPHPSWTNPTEGCSHLVSISASLSESHTAYVRTGGCIIHSLSHIYPE